MSPYIENLVKNLIGKNHYYLCMAFGGWREHKERQEELLSLSKDLDLAKLPTSQSFLTIVKRDLEINDVQQMNPATLGKIMCSLEMGDVMASKEDLFKQVTFDGSCDLMLRELVALCLAYAIRDYINITYCAAGSPFTW